MKDRRCPSLARLRHPRRAVGVPVTAAKRKCRRDSPRADFDPTRTWSFISICGNVLNIVGRYRYADSSWSTGQGTEWPKS
jgi:hypothetical protein